MRATPASELAIDMPRHIYIDCTETVRIGAQTGIQRTVRSILAAALRDATPGVVPVRFDGRAFVALDDRACADLGQPPVRGRALHERVRRLALAASAPVAGAAWLARGRDVASRSLWAAKRLRAGGARPERYRPGDWLVLLDGTWAPDLRAELARARGEGAFACAVVYDLIKLRRPDLVSPGASRIYVRWLERVLPLAHVVATISCAVRDDVVRYLHASGRAALAARVREFPLGADFDHGGARVPVSPAVASAIEGARERTFLAVGSLEARKDQATILAAFESLWRDGADVRLVLVGRRGWGSEALVRRLAAHAERGRRLFWFADATDADLVHCYRGARALVNVSLCEGYGLPLAEGLRHGLRVIASDIPAFREAAAGAALFVPAGDPQALAEAVGAVLREARGNAAMDAPAIATWSDSARALVALLDQARP
jgi:glycosyltransferase involved in cell wall biosynthesis